ncbi:AbrB/MazE/SpoVT family DNA-binding domain-containing protein (plasmid) [Neptuniibacter sp. QD72_48]|uniref:AbrB/MazE/SpoVT family DNA-binding domain-containing protein n=1 Tax=Neptuniibacter sp. QD72_48 TaxID=3398214 RepID=UPI0039F63254
MTTVALRKSGGSTIVSIPKKVMDVLGVAAGASLDLTVEGGKVVMTPIKEPEITLESLMVGYTSEDFKPTSEEREWIDAAPVGNEI